MRGRRLISRAKVLRVLSVAGSAALLLAFVLVLNWLISSMASAREGSTGATMATPTAESSPPQPPTDWIEHSDMEAGYSIRHPPGWFRRGRNANEWGIWDDFSSLDLNAQTIEPQGLFHVRVGVLRKINQEGFWNSSDVKGYFEYIVDQKEDVPRYQDPRYVVRKVGTLEVDGHIAVKQIEQTAPGAETESQYSVVVYFWEHDQLHMIKGTVIKESYWSLHERTFDALVNSFRSLR